MLLWNMDKFVGFLLHLYHRETIIFLMMEVDYYKSPKICRINFKRTALKNSGKNTLNKRL